ncbi:hypothetical protein [Desulfocurvus vexinensis]|uniref:hypothetical protein n=1 Tax=Desulfocurvus vexinensis TaxID=399548 RepID=UPI00048D16E4|nr:hypothetical protein [Desulfocurvus vexinensis]
MSDTDGPGGPVGVDKLRDEIIETQRGHLDMVKWKIVLVAALGAVGLGFQGAGTPGGGGRAALPAHYVLCLIPFVCAYCDLMLCTLLLRMYAIGAFLHRQGAAQGALLARYEHCIDSLRRGRDQHGGLFSFEGLAVFGSSFLFSALVFLVLVSLGEFALGLSGLAGVGFTLWIRRRFSEKQSCVVETMKRCEGGDRP